MGAGSSTEQRSPEQPEAGSATPAEPEPSSGGPAAEAAPGASGDPALAAPDPASKVRARRATCPGEAGVGRVVVSPIPACDNFPPIQPICQLGSTNSSFWAFRGLLRRGGTRAGTARAAGARIFVVGLQGRRLRHPQ